MVLPLIPILAGTVGGTLLGGSILGKKEYTTITEAPYHTYSPSMVYSPMTSIAYTSGAKIFNSPFAAASEKIGQTSENQPYLNSMPNSTTGFNPNAYIPLALIGGGLILAINLTKKK